MPLTLHEIRKYYPNQEGFAFGLTAGLLIPGYLFGLYMKEFELNGSQNTIAPLICLITGAGLLAIYLYRRFKKA
jgi:hypothetical protein